MDREKNQLQHNGTGRECVGVVRGLTGHPPEAAEVSEGYLSSQLDPPEKCRI